MGLKNLIEPEEVRVMGLNGYHILSKNAIGVGFFARVFAAKPTFIKAQNCDKIRFCRHAKQKVAIKVIYADTGFKKLEELVNVVPQEISTMNKCFGNPHMLSLVDAFVGAKRVFLVMEYAEKGDLDTLLSQLPKGYMKEHVALQYIRDIALGVQTLHSMGVAHRDLNPKNIFITKDNQVKLGDFGYATKGASLPELKTEDSPQPLYTTMCGAMSFAAPEVLDRNFGAYNAQAADVWSLGALLFTLMHGNPPFPGESAEEMLASYRRYFTNGEPVNFLTCISKKCRNLIWNMLKENPMERPTICEILDSKSLRKIRSPVKLPYRMGGRRHALLEKILANPEYDLATKGIENFLRARQKLLEEVYNDWKTAGTNKLLPRVAIPSVNNRSYITVTQNEELWRLTLGKRMTEGGLTAFCECDRNKVQIIRDLSVYTEWRKTLSAKEKEMIPYDSNAPDPSSGCAVSSRLDNDYDQSLASGMNPNWLLVKNEGIKQKRQRDRLMWSRASKQSRPHSSHSRNSLRDQEPSSESSDDEEELIRDEEFAAEMFDTNTGVGTSTGRKENFTSWHGCLEDIKEDNGQFLDCEGGVLQQRVFDTPHSEFIAKVDVDEALPQMSREKTPETEHLSHKSFLAASPQIIPLTTSVAGDRLFASDSVINEEISEEKKTLGDDLKTKESSPALNEHSFGNETNKLTMSAKTETKEKRNKQKKKKKKWKPSENFILGKKKQKKVEKGRDFHQEKSSIPKINKKGSTTKKKSNKDAVLDVITKTENANEVLYETYAKGGNKGHLNRSKRTEASDDHKPASVTLHADDKSQGLGVELGSWKIAGKPEKTVKKRKKRRATTAPTKKSNYVREDKLTKIQPAHEKNNTINITLNLSINGLLAKASELETAVQKNEMQNGDVVNVAVNAIRRGKALENDTVHSMCNTPVTVTHNKQTSTGELILEHNGIPALPSNHGDVTVNWMQFQQRGIPLSLAENKGSKLEKGDAIIPADIKRKIHDNELLSGHNDSSEATLLNKESKNTKIRSSGSNTPSPIAIEEKVAIQSMKITHVTGLSPLAIALGMSDTMESAANKKEKFSEAVNQEVIMHGPTHISISRNVSAEELNIMQPRHISTQSPTAESSPFRNVQYKKLLRAQQLTAGEGYSVLEKQLKAEAKLVSSPVLLSHFDPIVTVNTEQTGASELLTAVENNVEKTSSQQPISPYLTPKRRNFSGMQYEVQQGDVPVFTEINRELPAKEVIITQRKDSHDTTFARVETDNSELCIEKQFVDPSSSPTMLLSQISNSSQTHSRSFSSNAMLNVSPCFPTASTEASCAVPLREENMQSPLSDQANTKKALCSGNTYSQLSIPFDGVDVVTDEDVISSDSKPASSLSAKSRDLIMQKLSEELSRATSNEGDHVSDKLKAAFLTNNPPALVPYAGSEASDDGLIYCSAKNLSCSPSMASLRSVSICYSEETNTSEDAVSYTDEDGLRCIVLHDTEPINRGRSVQLRSDACLRSQTEGTFNKICRFFRQLVPSNNVNNHKLPEEHGLPRLRSCWQKKPERFGSMY